MQFGPNWVGLRQSPLGRRSVVVWTTLVRTAWPGSLRHSLWRTVAESDSRFDGIDQLWIVMAVMISSRQDFHRVSVD